MKEALKSLVGIVLGQAPDLAALSALKDKPVTADASVAAADGGVMEALDGVMDDLDLDDARKMRVMKLLCWADEAANSKVAAPIGYVKHKIGKGPVLESAEGYMLLAYLDAVWHVPARLDEEPMDAPGATPPTPPPQPVVAPPPPITVNVIGGAVPPPQASHGGSSWADPMPNASNQTSDVPPRPPPGQPLATPTPQRFVKTTTTGPEDPRWIKIRKEWLDPLFDQRDRAAEALDLDALKRADAEIDWVVAVLLGAYITEFVQLYGYDNGSRVRYYVVKRRNGLHVQEPSRFEEFYGPIPLML